METEVNVNYTNTIRVLDVSMKPLGTNEANKHNTTRILKYTDYMWLALSNIQYKDKILLTDQ